MNPPKTVVLAVVCCAVLAACSSSTKKPAKVTYVPPAQGSVSTLSITADGKAAGVRTLRIVSVVSSGANRVMTVDDTTPTAHFTLTETEYADGSVSETLPALHYASGDVGVFAKPLVFPPHAASAKLTTQTNTLVITKKGTKQTADVPATFTLSDEGTRSITVPAGTYNVQELDLTQVLTVDGRTATLTEKEYRASGVGIVEQDETQTVSGTSGSTSVQEKLTKFVPGKASV